MATAAPVLDLPKPETKKEAQELLRQHGITGLKIDAIEDGRIYALTAKKLMADNVMKRQAVTVVFVLHDDGVKAVQLFGWVVDRAISWSDL